MRLGVVATSDAAEAHVVGLLTAALRRQWTCRCFLTDSGVRLLNSAAFMALTHSEALRVDVCKHSWEDLDGGTAPAGVHMGSQYQNARLAHECERVVVL